METDFIKNAYLNEAHKHALDNIVSYRTLKKGVYWIEEGKINNKIALITRGYLRRYSQNDGREVTDHFYFEGDYSADIASILTKEPPKSSIVAMEDVDLIIVDFYAFEKLRQTYIELQTAYGKYLEQTYLQLHHRITSFVTQTPKERYYAFAKMFPQAIQRIPQYHLASYLGISPQHLSRLRHV